MLSSANGAWHCQVGTGHHGELAEQRWISVRSYGTWRSTEAHAVWLVHVGSEGLYRKTLSVKAAKAQLLNHCSSARVSTDTRVRFEDH